MAYTICNQFGDPAPIRLLNTHSDGTIFIGEAFIPVWWICDACNRPAERYSVDFGRHTQTYRWFEVIESDDDERTIKVKTEFALKVAAAAKNLEFARREYQKLVN